MPKNEKETRLELIDPKLKLAKWQLVHQKHIVEKSKACIETPIYGMPKTTINPTGHGFADYVLFGDDGKPLAVIEAKKSLINEEQGRVQACLYADALEKQYGQRPIIYYTNGYTIKVIDGVYPARTVFGFHKKDELEYLIKRREYKLLDKHVNVDICGRYYQKDAIDEVLRHFEHKHSRSLIVLATGTGKTRVSCGISDIFIRNNYVKRILFLADRKNLVRQAKEETFEKFLPTIPMATIMEGKREGDDNKARIVFSTYNSMLSIIQDTKKCPYGIGHFDLIIVDEAHRSLFNKYAEIFDYFDALMIGLTATPRNEIHRSTYKVFNLDTEMPNYEYDVVKGVKDGYLTYYRALDRTPVILKDGVEYDKLSEEERQQYEELFTDDDGNLPEKIEGEKFLSVIYNRDTIREVLRTLMDEGIRVDNGDRLGKTIIFARDHRHALLILEEFRILYPELCSTSSPNGVDYCVIIDNKIKYNEILQREFKNKQDIRIVVSVDMMDTGVDIPEVVNLVFFKRVLSKIKFWQMIGRGTRLCEKMNVLSPSKAYFERMTNDGTRQHYDTKQGFLIFDICNVFPFFKLNPDGKKDASDSALSLYQKIFMQKVALVKVMQVNFANLSIDDKKYYSELRTGLVQEVSNLNRNYIGVIKNLETINRFSKEDSWINLNNDDFVKIKKEVAPNVTGEIDLEEARTFDYLCYKFATTKFTPNNEFMKVAKTIYLLVDYLLKFKAHISEVSEKIEYLNYVVTDEFVQNSSVTKVNEIREQLRELIKYIDRVYFKPIITDFDDEITGTGDAVEDPVDFTVSIDDFKTLEEKIIFLIQNNKFQLIEDVRNIVKPTNEAVEELKKEIIKISASADEYNELFKDDEDIVTFVRKNLEFYPSAVNSFLDEERTNGFNDEQLNFLKELLLFISQNGNFDRHYLLRPELNFKGIFNSIEIGILLQDIENRM